MTNIVKLVISHPPFTLSISPNPVSLGGQPALSGSLATPESTLSILCDGIVDSKRKN
jgi:hypothetical protein